MKKQLFVGLIFLILNQLIYGQIDSTVSRENFNSRIYILRETGFNGGGKKFNVFLDGKLICRLKNKMFLIQEVKPGRHSFSIQNFGSELKEKTEVLEITTEANKVYYISTIHEDHPFSTNIYFLEIAERGAEKRVAKLKQADNCKK